MWMFHCSVADMRQIYPYHYLIVFYVCAAYGANWHFLRLLIEGCQWTAGLQVKSLWCHLGNSSLTSDAHLLKYHTWSTPLFLGVFQVNVHNEGSSQSKFNATLDDVRFEWSPPFGQFITEGFR
jgi:hypothetical protein